MAAFNGELFFNASDAANGREIWKSDGTAAGTEMVKDIWPGPNSGGARELTVVNGELFFSAFDPNVNGDELWKSDGTTAGTVLVEHRLGKISFRDRATASPAS